MPATPFSSLPMKFLHAADIHLDSPLCGLSAYPDAPAERLRTATRSAFVRLIDTALAAGVLNPEEAHSLQQAEAARRVVIDVDDFDKEELTLETGKVR